MLNSFHQLKHQRTKIANSWISLVVTLQEIWLEGSKQFGQVSFVWVFWLDSFERWPMKVSKIVLGKTAENEKSVEGQKCRIEITLLGKSTEN